MCCGRTEQVTIPAAQQKIIEAVKANIKSTSTSTSAVKSNRSRPGMPVRECPVCGTKTVANLCPICSYNF